MSDPTPPPSVPRLLPPPVAPEPSRTPDAADLALAKAATPWLGIQDSIGGDHADEIFAQALAAWLTARGIY